jgi:glycosyltransferase involved in cell wall biosynthesis
VRGHETEFNGAAEMDLIAFLRSAATSWSTVVRSRRPKDGIALLDEIWSHHARRSGYHPVTEGLGLVLKRYGTRLVPRLVSGWAVGEDLDTAFQIALAMKLKGCDRLIVINGDSELALIEQLRRVSAAKIYAVFHQIPSVLVQYLKKAPPLKLDGAICVARCQTPLLHAIASPGKTWFVPHGVDTTYFTPRGSCSDRPRVLCVGAYCRDFDTLRESAEIILQAIPESSVRLVAHPSILPPGLNLGRVELIAGAADDQLLEEYRRAWVVLLPLSDSTANNALLEGLACGKPVVASDVGGVRDYMGPECGALCPSGDAKAHATAVVDLLLDEARRRSASAAARARAEICAWPVVQQQIRRLTQA